MAIEQNTSRQEPSDLPRRRTDRLAFRVGAALPFRALAFLARRPGLWPAVAAPLAINLIVFSTLLGWGFGEFSETMQGWLSGQTGWHWAILAWLARIVFWAIALALVYFIFTPIALIIAAPFNDWLSVRTEKACGMPPPEDSGSPIRSMVSDAWFAIAAECQRMLYFAGISLAILCLSFIPAAGAVIFPAVSFYWICRYSAFEFVCYSADRRRLPWKEVWRMLRGNWPVSSGFGAMTALLLMIPFVNVLIVTVSAVGGTFLFGLIQRGATDGSGEKQTESEITPPSREPAGGAWV